MSLAQFHGLEYLIASRNILLLDCSAFHRNCCTPALAISVLGDVIGKGKDTPLQDPTLFAAKTNKEC